MTSEKINPRKGLTFLHARRIDGSPKAGTATPVEMVVTTVRQGTVYYGRADVEQPRGDWYIAVADFDSIVLRLSDDGEGEAVECSVAYPCGHFTVERGCGGCDEGAVAFTLTDSQVRLLARRAR